MALLTQWREPEPFAIDANFDYEDFNKMQENFLYLNNRPMSKITALGSGLSNLSIGTSDVKEGTGFFRISTNTKTGNVLLFGQLRVLSVGNAYVYVSWEVDGEYTLGGTPYNGSSPVAMPYYSRDVATNHTLNFMIPITDLEVGTHTFEPVFRTTSGSATFYTSSANTFIGIMEL